MQYSLLFVFISVMTLLLLMESLINKKMKIGWLILVSLFVLFSSIRNISVPDTWGYINSFTTLRLTFDSLRYTTYEPGFVILSLFVKKFISVDHKIYFGIITAINLLIMKKAFKNYNLKLLIIPTVIYISFYGFYFNFITLRAGLAFSFICYSWSIFNKNKFRSLLLLLTACLFHISSLFVLPSYLLINKKVILTKKLYYFWIMLISILYLIKIDIIFIDRVIDLVNYFNLFDGHRFSYYINNIKFNYGISFKFYFNIFYLIVFILFKDKKDNRYNYLININMIGLTIVSFFPSFMWVERVTDFYIATNIILASLMFEKIKDAYLRYLIILPFVYMNIVFVVRIINRN